MPIHNPDPAAAPTGLYVARRDGPEDFLPTTGAPVTVTSGAGAYAFGDWATVGTPASDFYLSWIHVVNVPPWAGLETLVLELAYGDAKTPVDVVRGILSVFNLGPDTVFVIAFPSVSRAVRVPAGETIYARLACTAGGNKDAETFIAGWPAPFPTWQELDQNTVTGPGRLYPSNAAGEGVVVGFAGDWAYGDSTTIIDPAPNDMLITRLIPTSEISALIIPAAVLQVGYGPSGSETWCATAAYGRASNSAWVYPPVLIQEGERLALRGTAANPQGLCIFVKVYDL